MSEYVVRWKHTRYGAAVDGVIKHVRSGEVSVSKARQMLNVYSLYTISTELPGITPSQYGGKTQCNIYSTVHSCGCKSNGLIPVASAETICSWRDQFDRRVGRLYSLALALCELKAADFEDKWRLLQHHFAHTPTPPFLWGNLATAICYSNKSAVKNVCAEIVASWKPNRKAMKRTETNAGIRSLSSCVQGGDSDVMLCGHSKAYIRRSGQKRNDHHTVYTAWCSLCAAEAQQNTVVAEAQQQGEEARDADNR